MIKVERTADAVGLKRAVESYLRLSQDSCKNTLSGIEITEDTTDPSNTVYKVKTGRASGVSNSETDHYFLRYIKDQNGNNAFERGGSSTKAIISYMKVRIPTSSDNLGSFQSSCDSLPEDEHCVVMEIKYAWDEAGDSKDFAHKMIFLVGLDSNRKIDSCPGFGGSTQTVSIDFLDNSRASIPATCPVGQLLSFDEGGEDYECSSIYKPTSYFERRKMELIPNASSTSNCHKSQKTGVVCFGNQTSFTSDPQVMEYEDSLGSKYMKSYLYLDGSDDASKFNLVDRQVFKAKVSGKLFVSAYVPVRAFPSPWVPVTGSIYYKTCTTESLCSGGWYLLSFTTLHDKGSGHSSGGAALISGKISITKGKYYHFYLDASVVSGWASGRQFHVGSIFEADHRFFGIWEFLESF